MFVRVPSRAYEKLAVFDLEKVLPSVLPKPGCNADMLVLVFKIQLLLRVDSMRLRLLVRDLDPIDFLSAAGSRSLHFSAGTRD